MSGAASNLAKKRAQAAGLGSNTKPIKYLNQDFEALRSKCLSSGQLFCDPTFPAAPESLGYNELGPAKTEGVEWKRPSELCSQPKFIISGATITDIRQGPLGDCWLMAAVACLTLNQEILARVIYPEQSFEKDYAGIFHFQLWQFGQWVDVVVDDLLPTKNGNLCFSYSTDRNEFWSSLLEKAYAKVSGCYEALVGGTANEAFEDLTGGIAERYEHLDKAPPNLFNTMKCALSRGSLLSAIMHLSEKAKETEAKENLCWGHVYSITAAEEIKVGGNLVQLVRLRNPWGSGEWNGAWSDGSKEWNDVQSEDRAKLHHKAEDGEFWMAYSDYVERFSDMEICNLTPDSLSSGHVGQWALQQFEGSWKSGCTSGGHPGHTDTFWTNPQFKITLLEEDNDPDNKEVACSLLVALMQKNRRHDRLHDYPIGFYIYKVPDEFEGSQNVCLNKDFFEHNACCARTDSITNLREVSKRFRLAPGEYLIIPCTPQPGDTADFLLRVFTEKQSTMQEMCHKVSFTLCEKGEIMEQDIDASIRSMFSQFSGEDMKISVDEFRTILNSAVSKFTDLKTDGFSVETCRQVVDFMVDNGSARVSLVELQLLWNRIKNWLEIFRTFDQDKSGTMNSYELRLALESAGFKLNNELIEMLVGQYGDGKTVSFDKFILCLFRLEDTLRAFQWLDTDGTGFAKLDASEWVYLTMQKVH